MKSGKNSENPYSIYHLLYSQEIIFNIIQTFTFHQGIGLSLQTLTSLPTLPEAITLLDIFSSKINRMSPVADSLELGVMKQYLCEFILCLKHKLGMCIWLFFCLLILENVN